jgi:hypothetical protein
MARLMLYTGPSGCSRWWWGRVWVKMAQAVQLAQLHPVAAADRAPGWAAAAGEFGEHDLAAILAHQAYRYGRGYPGPVSGARCRRAPAGGHGTAVMGWPDDQPSRS